MCAMIPMFRVRSSGKLTTSDFLAMEAGILSRELLGGSLEPLDHEDAEPDRSRGDDEAAHDRDPRPGERHLDDDEDDVQEVVHAVAKRREPGIQLEELGALL